MLAQRPVLKKALIGGLLIFVVYILVSGSPESVTEVTRSDNSMKRPIHIDRYVDENVNDLEAQYTKWLKTF